MGNCVCEALTGVVAGRVLSREIITRLWGAEAVDGSVRQNRMHRYREMRTNPARSETLCMHSSILYGSREIP